MKDLVCLDIADFFIRIGFTGFDGIPACKTPYEHFIANRKKKIDLDVDLRIKNGQLFYKKGVVFDTEYSWKLHKLSRGYLYEDRLVRKSYEKYVRQAFIEDNYRKATIYSSKLLVKEKGGINWAFDLPLGHFLIVNILAECQGLMLHSCAVKYKNKAFVCIGKSGAGKSTLAGLFKKVKGVTVLSDERIILRKIGGEFIAYGTPWTGSSFAFAQDHAVLDRVYLIHHAKKNVIEAIGGQDAVPTFLSNIRLPLWDRDKTMQVLDTANTVLSSIPFFKLGFLPDQRIIDSILS
jgi:hypothetical protein